MRDPTTPPKPALRLILAAASAIAPATLAQVSPPASPAPDHTQPQPAAAPTLTFETRATLALHMAARAAAGRGDTADDLYSLAGAVARAAGTDQVWLAIDPLIAGGEAPEALAQRLDGIPLERALGEKAAPARGALRLYLQALAGAEPKFAREEWPAIEAGLRERARRLRTSMLDGEPGLLGRTLAGLGLPAEGASRIALAPEAPAPGAATYRTRSGPVSIVGVNGLDDDTLLEVALHESIHAFDSTAAGDRTDVLTLLRGALAEAGLGERDPRARAAWHAVFFVHAAEMVRRDGRPAYVDYGARFGAYERTGEIANVVGEAWPQVLDRALGVQAFTERLAAAAAASPAG